MTVIRAVLATIEVFCLACIFLVATAAFGMLSVKDKSDDLGWVSAAWIAGCVVLAITAYALMTSAG